MWLPRGGSQNLADYISVNDGKINSINSQINDLQDNNTSLSNQIKSLSSGSPKGSYATVSALKSANPETGVYIIQEDGHIYSWTKNGNDAIDLGVYQATEIEDDTIDTKKIKDNAIVYEKIGDKYLTAIEDNFKKNNLYSIDNSKVLEGSVVTPTVDSSFVADSYGHGVAIPFSYSIDFSKKKFLFFNKLNITKNGYIIIGIIKIDDLSGQIQQMFSKIITKTDGNLYKK